MKAYALVALLGVAQTCTVNGEYYTTADCSGNVSKTKLQGGPYTVDACSKVEGKSTYLKITECSDTTFTQLSYTTEDCTGEST